MEARTSSGHEPIDSSIHRAILAAIVEVGHAPGVAELASALGICELEVRSSLRRLAENHGLVLHPGSDAVWIAHPFSLSPTGTWVARGDRGWWAPCLWCALGITTLVGDATIHVRFGGEAEGLTIAVQEGVVEPTGLLIHFALPPREAWNNVIHYCATLLPFRSGKEIDDWCARHALPRGTAVPVSTVLSLARAWYGRHMDEDWHKWTAAEAQTIFESVGLTGPFWSLSANSGRF